MKKTLSLVLALCMILSMCVISIAAADSAVGSVASGYTPEGTAITDAAGFAAMAADGNYYLANDITISEPYATAFTGTFDGNGKTVTVSQPMFVDFGGTIKNLIVEGSVTSLAADAEIAALAADGARGAVAAHVNSGTEVVFENIKNNASVSATGSLASDDCAGGLVGKVECADVVVKFINCENNATITGLNQLGGIVGYIKTASSAYYENCVNNGEVKEAASSAYSGGIVCRPDCDNTFINCVNNAKISAGKDQAGGILAYASKGSHTFEGCVNNGEIAPAVGKAGGIIGNINCNDAEGKNGEFVKVIDCINTGKITSAGADCYAGGIACQIQKTENFTITGCVNTADITGAHDTGGIVGHTTQAIMFVSYCENTGKVVGSNYGGGIVGYGQGTKDSTQSAANGGVSNVVEYCINKGEVIGSKRAGGISASNGTDATYGVSYIRFCINTGNVTSNGAHTNAAGNCAGGIVAYAYGAFDEAYTVVDNCITTGNILAKNADISAASYFLGYINSPLAVVTNNVALGTLTCECATGVAAIGYNNENEFAAENLTGNALPADNAYPLTYENTNNTKTYTVGQTDTAAITSGKLVYEINQAYKAATGATEDVFFMTIDGSFAPTIIPAVDEKGIVTNAVVLSADGVYANPQPEPETTEPAPETTVPAPETTEPGSSSDTGDSFAIFAVIAAISVLGVAVIAKRREN